MTVLIKLGGSILEDAQSIRQISQDCKKMLDAGASLILVHGGGKAINRALAAQNISSTFFEGLRITSAEMMDVIEKVLCGEINKKLVRMLNSAGVPAVGLSGVDGELISCSSLDSRLGYVGRIEKINIALLRQLLTLAVRDRYAVPVIAPIGVNSDGRAMNINADWAAAGLAIALNLKKLIFLTDTQGIYCNGSVLQRLSKQDLQHLIGNAHVTGGMLAKTKAVLYALNNGVEQVHIVCGAENQVISNLLNDSLSTGTLCLAESR